MAIFNINDITNLYLYGQLTTPVNLLDSSLIRPKDTVIREKVVSSKNLLLTTFQALSKAYVNSFPEIQ